MTDFWHTGLCDCCNECGSCCITCWVPCVQYGMNAEKLGSSCCLCGVLYCVLIPCCTTWYQRSKIRSKYGIAGGPCTDFINSCFCEPCALCQMSRELDYQLTHPKENGGNGTIVINNNNDINVSSTGPSANFYNGQPQGGAYPPAPPPQGGAYPPVPPPQGGAYPPPNYSYHMQPPPQPQDAYPNAPAPLDVPPSAPAQPTMVIPQSVPESTDSETQPLNPK